MGIVPFCLTIVKYLVRTMYIEPPEVRVETVEWPVESSRTSAPREWKYSLLATTVSDRE